MFYRWRLFRHTIIAHPKSVIAYIKAAVALHNFLRCTESAVYCPTGYVDGKDGEGNMIRGSWKNDAETATGMTAIAMTGSNRCVLFNLSSISKLYCRYSKSASETRSSFKDYFNGSVGQVSWQYQHVRKTD